MRGEAVKSGCDEGSIDLDDWYVDEDGKNYWKGRCQDPTSGKAIKFSINVDKVWTPSSDK